MHIFKINDNVLRGALNQWGIKLQVLKTIEEIVEYEVVYNKYTQSENKLDWYKEVASEEADVLIMTSQIEMYMREVSSSFAQYAESHEKFAEAYCNKDAKEIPDDITNIYILRLIHTVDGKEHYSILSEAHGLLLARVDFRRKALDELTLGEYTEEVQRQINYKLMRVNAKLMKKKETDKKEALMVEELKENLNDAIKDYIESIVKGRFLPSK
jgi:hypothetical protein